MEHSTPSTNLEYAPSPSRRRLAAAGTILSLALLVLAACTSPPVVPPPEDFEEIAATFDADAEGWTSAEPEAPTWQAPGYLQVVDFGGDWQYAVAPAKFLGDWTGAGAVSFDVLADPGLVVYPVRVMITGGGHVLYVEFPVGDLVPGDWVTLSAPLTAPEWRHFDGESSEGVVATQTELDEALADVTDLRIRLDTTDKSGGDEVNGLDDVLVE